MSTQEVRYEFEWGDETWAKVHTVPAYIPAKIFQQDEGLAHDYDDNPKFVRVGMSESTEWSGKYRAVTRVKSDSGESRFYVTMTRFASKKQAREGGKSIGKLVGVVKAADFPSGWFYPSKGDGE